MQESASARIPDFFCAISIHGVFLLLHRSPYLVHPYWRSALPRCTVAGSRAPRPTGYPRSPTSKSRTILWVSPVPSPLYREGRIYWGSNASSCSLAAAPACGHWAFAEPQWRINWHSEVHPPIISRQASRRQRRADSLRLHCHLRYLGRLGRMGRLPRRFHVGTNCPVGDRVASLRLGHTLQGCAENMRPGCHMPMSFSRMGSGRRGSEISMVRQAANFV